MKPQTKVAILTGAGIFLLATLLALFGHYLLLESYVSLENQHVLKDIQRAALHIDSEIESLQRQLEDWAAWDESYEFIQQPAPNFIARNLTSASIHRLELSAIALADNTGRIIFGSALDPASGILSPLPRGLKEILTRNSPLLSLKQGHKGTYLLPSGPILIASEPIFDSAKSLPARGVMIMCRPLDGDLLKKLELLTQLNLTLQPVTSDTLPADFLFAKAHLRTSHEDVTLPLSDTEIGGYSLVRDFAGEPVLILRAKTNRDFYQEGIASIRHFTLWFFLAALIAGGMIIWLFHKIAITRNENLENEKICQFALEGSGDGAWDWNVPGGKVFFSDRFKEILGFAGDELENRWNEWSEFIHHDDMLAATEAFDKIFHGLTSSCSFEHRIRCKNGDYRWILNRCKVIRHTAEGKPIRITGTITDTTEHRLMEEQVFRSQKLESVGILAGGIAHDFNNILTAVIGYTSLARIFIEKPDKALKALEEAEKASHRATKLTQQLLTFAQGGSPIKQCVSAENLLHESVSFALRGTKVKGNCSIPESLYVEADEEQMSQAFNNIILNAVQAMLDGGELTIKAENIPLEEKNVHELPAGSYIMISFSDQGCGIPPENLSKIFDPFFSTKTGCTGIGLSAAYSIVRKHGGTINVHSVMGSGTTVTLHIPSSEKKHSQQLALDEKSIAISQCRGHILVMDDEEMIRNLSSELLGIMGYQVCTCSSGDEAIERYKTAQEMDTPFSAVIMDLTIPGGMGGKDAAQAILAIDPYAQLIVSSGYSNDPVLAEYDKYGFVAAVSKPYTVDKIIKTMSFIDSDEHSGKN
jgi:PAS domain S-box-containing protein